MFMLKHLTPLTFLNVLIYGDIIVNGCIAVFMFVADIFKPVLLNNMLKLTKDLLKLYVVMHHKHFIYQHAKILK